jgi:hypothetical protein
LKWEFICALALWARSARLTIEAARQKSFQAVNTVLIDQYWQIGNASVVIP